MTYTFIILEGQGRHDGERAHSLPTIWHLAGAFYAWPGYENDVTMRDARGGLIDPDELPSMKETNDWFVNYRYTKEGWERR